MLTLLKGTELQGRYVIHDVVGTGGSASVWKASDKQLNRDVALKRLWKQLIGTPGQDLTALLDEARKNAQLVHPNIVQVHDIIEVEGEQLIVMEYVDGPSLFHVLREKAKKAEPFPYDRAVAILGDVLSGVAYAHSKNVCHRDLSPMNILLTSSSIPKIADFGIARVLPAAAAAQGPPASSQGGTGNPHFMSPEQARGEAADFFSDLFTVGIAGYLLLTGRHPFADSSGLFTIPENIKDADYLPETPRLPANLTTSQQRLFREYAAIVMRLLHRERAGRYGSAVEAIDAIEAVTPTLDCPKCGERIPDQYRFCGFCGASLEVATPPPVPPVAPLPVPTLTPDQLVEEGFLLSRGNRWDAAVERYRQALSADADFQKAYRNLGFALNRLRQYDEAVAVLTKGLALPAAAPEHRAGMLYERSYAFFNLTRYEEALQDVEEALKLQPDSARFLYYRARIQRYRGRFAEAQQDARDVLRRIPDHAGALRLLDELG